MTIIKKYKEEQKAGLRRKRIPAMEMVGWGTERTRMPEVALGRFSVLIVSHFPLRTSGCAAWSSAG